MCRFWRVQNKCPSKLRRASDKEPLSPDAALVSPSSLLPSSRPPLLTARRWTEVELEEEDENEADSKESTSSSPGEATPFRERASTDGNLFQRPWRWRYSPATPSSSQSSQSFYPSVRNERRMSISMRGNNASY